VYYGVIAAAVVLLLVFGSLLAVFVDAFIIRMGIVPAAMFLLGRSNWWFPAKLDRALPSLAAESLDELPAEPAEPVEV
jgi:putative drug exporter of the RND superfamily